MPIHLVILLPFSYVKACLELVFLSTKKRAMTKHHMFSKIIITNLNHFFIELK